MYFGRTIKISKRKAFGGDATITFYDNCERDKAFFDEWWASLSKINLMKVLCENSNVVMMDGTIYYVVIESGQNSYTFRLNNPDAFGSCPESRELVSLFDRMIDYCSRNGYGNRSDSTELMIIKKY